jgi:hypothetical protein
VIISTYNLRYSVLRFQIFLVDENQIANATDLLCETTPIYEYEGRGFLLIIITDMPSECSFFQIENVRVFQRRLEANEKVKLNVPNRN